MESCFQNLLLHIKKVTLSLRSIKITDIEDRFLLNAFELCDGFVFLTDNFIRYNSNFNSENRVLKIKCSLKYRFSSLKVCNKTIYVLKLLDFFKIIRTNVDKILVHK